MSDTRSLTVTQHDPHSGLRTIIHYPDRSNREVASIRREIARGAWVYASYGIVLTAEERRSRVDLDKRIRADLAASAAEFADED